MRWSPTWTWLEGCRDNMPRMGYIVVEEWADNHNPYKYHWIQVSATTFPTREEANDEAKKHQPQHTDGYIRVRKDPEEEATRKPRTRRTLRGRVSRRNGRRR